MQDELYVFTFGDCHKYAGRYLVLKGTFNETRKKAFELFGDKWAFQYTMEEWNNVINKLKQEYPFAKLEKEITLKEIEQNERI